MKDKYDMVFKRLSEYKLNKKERAMIYQQIQDVLEQTEQEIDEAFIDELIDDVFEYNNISKIKDKKYSYNHIFWGLWFILASILIIFTNIPFLTTLAILCIPLIIYCLTKRAFFISMILTYFVLSYFLWMTSFSILIGLIIGYIGLKILFFNKKESVKYHEFNKYENYKYNNEETKQDEGAHEEGADERAYDDNKSGVLFLTNNFNGLNLKLTTEKISYINLQNKCGGCEIDLRNFDFLKGDLVINVDNMLGGITFKINPLTEASVIVSSKFGGVGNQTGVNKFKEKPLHRVYIQGDNKFGGVDVTN